MSTEFHALAAMGASKQLARHPVRLEPQKTAVHYDRKKAATRYLRVVPSLAEETTPYMTEQFVRHLRALREPASFEAFNLAGKVQLQFVVQNEDIKLITDGLTTSHRHTHTELLEADPLYRWYKSAKERKRSGQIALEYHFRDYYIPPPFFLPILAIDSFQGSDPLEAMFAVMQELSDDELAIYQLLLIPCRTNWHKAARDLLGQRQIQVNPIALGDGNERVHTKEVHPEIPEHELKFITARAFAKIDADKPFFACALRCAVFTNAAARAASLLQRLEASLNNFVSGPRRLRFLDRIDYYNQGLPKDDHFYLLFNRVAFRPGFLLNSGEIASLCHLPFPSVLSKDYKLDAVQRSYAAPEYLTENGEFIGENTHRGQNRPVYISGRLQNRHCYMLGKSGCGKSTLIQNLVLEHLRKGDGFGVIDQHGTLIADQILPFIPESRVGDVVLLDAGDFEHPLAFNLLAHSGSKQEKEHIRTDLLNFFEELLGDKLGVNIEHLLNFSLATLLTRKDSTLADIERLMIDDQFRENVLRDISDERMLRFWEMEFPVLMKTSVTTITNKLSPLLLPDSTVQPMLTTRENKLDFLRMMDEGKIFLCNLSHGKIGKRTAQLLGRLIISRIQISAMMRQASPALPDWYLYVDEFQHMTSPSMKDILSGARKYKLHLTLANQVMGDIPQDILKNVFNASTLLFFNSDLPQEQHFIEQVLAKKFTTEEVGQLRVGEAFAKIENNVFNVRTLPPPKVPTAGYVSEIVRQSRIRYGVQTTQKEDTMFGRRPSVPKAAPVKARPKDAEPQVARREEKRRIELAMAQPKQFSSNQEKILHFLLLAQYLSTPQILELCYRHIDNPNSRKSTASQDLKKLIEKKLIKEMDDRKPKIYFIGSRANPSKHNLAVRDVFTKLVRSEFEIHSVAFSDSLGGLKPDLIAEFKTVDNSLVRTHWEIDMGTENYGELIDKAERYARKEKASIYFVFATSARRERARPLLSHYASCYAVTLADFTGLAEPVFYSGSSSGPLRFIETIQCYSF